MTSNVLASLAMASMAVPAAAAAHETSTTPIVAQGNTLLNISADGRTSLKPDMAVFSAGVTTQGATAGEAMAANSTSMARAIAALKAAGIADRDIQTSHLNLNPVYGQQRQLPDGTRVLSSSARRTDETVRALGRRYKALDELRPGATADQLLKLVAWPLAKVPVLVVGHQPTLGQVAAQLLGLPEGECAIKKGAIWWLRSREREGEHQTVVVAVLTAELV